jgi:chromosome segregation ATPase
MFKLFKKKEEEAGAESSDEEGKKPKEEPKSDPSSASLISLSTDIDRIKASIESFGEVRQSFNERLSNMSEQIGELRAMILDRDRNVQEIELKAVKAADMVESVQPDKLMIEIQKMDAKFEALKANLEGNESILERVMEELKEARKKMEFFRGIDEIIKLSEEVKKELIDVKQVEASINIKTDKVDTLYAEIRRKYKDIDVFNDGLQEVKANLEQSLKDVESLKVKAQSFADKEDLEKLGQKMQRYIESLKEINKKSALSKDLANLKSMLDDLK